MSCYICHICDRGFDSDYAGCYEYKDKYLICEDCRIELDEQEGVK